MADWNKSTTDVLLYTPWLSRVILGVPGRAVPGCGVVGTDGRKVIYDPAIIAKWSQAELCGVRVHEALHVLLGHAHRQPPGAEHTRWNVACDYALNPFVIAAGYTLPDGALLDPQYDGMSAEEVYKQLPHQVSMAAWGQVSPASGTQDEKEEEFIKLAKDALAGNLPDNLARPLGDMVAQPPDWRAILAEYMTRCAETRRDDWTRPSRRMAGLPGHVAERAGRWALIIDTSGSMTSDLLGRVVSVARPIAGDMDIIAADAAVCAVKTDADLHDISWLEGGGGTDFRPALEFAVNGDYDAAIYLTDGYGEYGSPIALPVIWVIMGDIVAPWGHTINIKE